MRALSTSKAHFSFSAIGCAVLFILLAPTTHAQGLSLGTSTNVAAPKERALPGEANSACLQKQRQKGIDAGGAFEICHALRPDCSPDGLPEGCAFTIRIPLTGEGAKAGGQVGLTPGKK